MLETAASAREANVNVPPNINLFGHNSSCSLVMGVPTTAIVIRRVRMRRAFVVLKAHEPLPNHTWRWRMPNIFSNDAIWKQEQMISTHYYQFLLTLETSKLQTHLLIEHILQLDDEWPPTLDPSIVHDVTSL